MPKKLPWDAEEVDFPLLGSRVNFPTGFSKAKPGKGSAGKAEWGYTCKVCEPNPWGGDTFAHCLAFLVLCLQVVKLGNPEIARQLLLRGADPDLKDRTGFAVLHDAARAGFLDTLQTLLEFEADVNVEDNEGNLPLHLAAQEGHLAVVAFLLERTASRVEHRNKKGATAYDLAKLYKRQAVAKLLENSRRREGALSGD